MTWNNNDHKSDSFILNCNIFSLCMWPEPMTHSPCPFYLENSNEIRNLAPVNHFHQEKTVETPLILSLFYFKFVLHLFKPETRLCIHSTQSPETQTSFFSLEKTNILYKILF